MENSPVLDIHIRLTRRLSRTRRYVQEANLGNQPFLIPVALAQHATLTAVLIATKETKQVADLRVIFCVTNLSQ
jgi:hypothetical protein